MAMQRTNPPHTARRNRGRSELYNARKPRRRFNWACCVLIAVIFIGSFAQVYSLACLMKQNGVIRENSAYVRQLRDDVRNAENVLLQHTNINVIRRGATALGMVAADSCEIRHVQVTLSATGSDTNAQTAYGGGNQ